MVRRRAERNGVVAEAVMAVQERQCLLFVTVLRAASVHAIQARVSSQAIELQRHLKHPCGTLKKKSSRDSCMMISCCARPCIDDVRGVIGLAAHVVAQRTSGKLKRTCLRWVELVSHRHLLLLSFPSHFFFLSRLLFYDDGLEAERYTTHSPSSLHNS